MVLLESCGTAAPGGESFPAQQLWNRSKADIFPQPDVSFFVRFFIRLGQNLPQGLAEIDNLFAPALGALEFAHVAAGKGGLLDLVHLNAAIRAGGVAHKMVSLINNPIVSWVLRAVCSGWPRTF